MGTRDIPRRQYRTFAKLRRITLSWGMLMALICVIPVLIPAPSSGQVSQNAGTPVNPYRLGDSGDESSPPLSPGQKLSRVRANFEKSKSDAAELAALAKGLCEALNKPKPEHLPLEVFNRADKIEKLARKIRDETKGY